MLLGAGFLAALIDSFGGGGLASILTTFVTGFYDGFFGPGTGSFPIGKLSWDLVK